MSSSTVSRASGDRFPRSMSRSSSVIRIVSLWWLRKGAPGAGRCSSTCRSCQNSTYRLRDIVGDIIGAASLFLLLWLALVAGAVLS